MKLLIGDGVNCKKGVILLKENAPKDYVTLIRLDKPIYQPGDKVRFLVLALNNDTTPFNFEHINVKVLNSRGKEVKTFNASTKAFKFDGSFEIPDEAKSETWSLKVNINKNKLVTTKSFEVEKEPDNRVKVFIEAPSKMSIFHHELSINVFAKHYTGVFASGRATIKAEVLTTDGDDDRISSKKKTAPLNGRYNEVLFSLKKDFGISILASDVKIVITVIFKDDLTGNEFLTSKEVYLTISGKYILKYDSKPFHRGHEHELIVKVHTLSGNLIADQAMRVDMIAKYSHDPRKYHRFEVLRNGAVKFILNATQVTDFIDIELKKDNCQENFRIRATVEEDFFEISLPDQSYVIIKNIMNFFLNFKF